MAICDLCSQEMTTGASCTVGILHADGAPHDVFRYGEDPGWGRPDGRCPDCGVQPGGFHHVGCDVQACPRCRRQLISCGCRWDELAHEYVDDEVDETPVVDLRPVAPVGPPRGLVPFGAAVAPLRARHHTAVRAVAEWGLANGRPCDGDVLAICLEALERRRGADGLRLHRPTVNAVLWGAVRNEATRLDTTLPEDWHVHLWTIVCWLADTGALTDDSDPLAALLEPLRCYGGLGADGYPMPPGVDVDFPCQCYVAHDPTCPPGLYQHIVGSERDTGREFIARVHLRLRSDDPPLSSYQPLFQLARRLRHGRSRFEIHPDEFTYVGWTDPARSVPELWLYRYDPESRRGFDDLVLDAHGSAWITRPDRRRKAGYRWARADDRTGLLRAGVEPRPWHPDRDDIDAFDDPSDWAWDLAPGR